MCRGEEERCAYTVIGVGIWWESSSGHLERYGLPVVESPTVSELKGRKRILFGGLRIKCFEADVMDYCDVVWLPKYFIHQRKRGETE